MDAHLKGMEDWQAPRPRTLVDHVIEAIIAAAARGVILPGERITEKDLGEMLKLSRVPIREALRVLESDGVVVSEPYKGMRLMDVSKTRLEQILDVRAALETLAITRALEKGPIPDVRLSALEAEIREMQLMCDRRDPYGLAEADTRFHLHLVELADNPPLVALWQSLARQLTVIIGLTTLEKTLDAIVEEHVRLLSQIRGGEIGAVRAELDEHIRTQINVIDFDLLIEKQRARREAAPTRKPAKASSRKG